MLLKFSYIVSWQIAVNPLKKQNSSLRFSADRGMSLCLQNAKGIVSGRAECSSSRAFLHAHQQGFS